MSIFENSRPDQLLVIIRHQGNGAFSCTHQQGEAPYYLNPAMAFFKEVFEGQSIPEMMLLVSLHDGVDNTASLPAPVFGFSKRKRDNSTLLLPDPYYINKRGYSETFAEMDRYLKIFQWEKKRPGAFWRGSSTGRPFLSKTEWRQNPRVRLCQIAKDAADNNLLDAKLARITQCESPEIEQTIAAEGLTDVWVAPEAFATFKIQIEIDGNACSWGFFQKLYMLSAVLKVESDFIQWYYDRLIPWTHFIPVKSDLSDLLEQIDWVQKNDRAAHEMAQASQAVARSLNYEVALEHTRNLLRQTVKYRTS